MRCQPGLPAGVTGSVVAILLPIKEQMVCRGRSATEVAHPALTVGLEPLRCVPARFSTSRFMVNAV